MPVPPKQYGIMWCLCYSSLLDVIRPLNKHSSRSQHEQAWQRVQLLDWIAIKQAQRKHAIDL